MKSKDTSVSGSGRMKNFSAIFRFTLICQFRAKGWRRSTVAVGLLFFALALGVILLAEGSGAFESGTKGGEDTATRPKTVYVVNETGSGTASLDVLDPYLPPELCPEHYEICRSAEEAASRAAKDPESLVLLFTREDENGAAVHVLVPDDSQLAEETASAYGAALSQNLPVLLMAMGGISDPETIRDVYEVLEAVQVYQQTGQLPEGTVLPEGIQLPETKGAEGEEADKSESSGEEDFSMQGILEFLLPFFNILILYFMVLAYGQSVAQCVLMEKTSRLMDTFLLCTDPPVMVTGKVLAVVLASILQFLIFLASFFLGIAAGLGIVSGIHPDSTLAVLSGYIPQLFHPDSIPAAILAVLLIFAGFVLYCSLSSIGGALAGKQEDLSSANMLFTIALVISFFVTLYGGGVPAMGMADGYSPVLNWVPFTAVLVLPSRLVLGEESLLQGAASLGVTLGVSLLIMVLAGKIYEKTALYQGDVPGPAKIWGMLRGKA